MDNLILSHKVDNEVRGISRNIRILRELLVKEHTLSYEHIVSVLLPAVWGGRGKMV